MVELSGLRIINTRPLRRAQALTTALQQAGAVVDDLPLLETLPLPLTPEQQQWLRALDHYRWVFVVSPTAAELGLKYLADYWPQWPQTVHWLAVGDSTAQVLRAARLQPLVPVDENSEALLQLDVLTAVQPGERMLVLRGDGGRNLVRDSLQTQGVRVDYVNLYHRRMPQAAVDQWRQLSAHSSLPEVVILTSGETLYHWLNLAGAAARQITPLVISARLAALSSQAGLKPAIVAASARPDAIISALSAWRNPAKHGID